MNNLALENRMHLVSVPAGDDGITAIVQRFQHGTEKLNIFVKALAEVTLPALGKVYLNAFEI